MSDALVVQIEKEVEEINKFLPMHLREADLDHPLRNYAREQADHYRRLADDVVADAGKCAEWHRKHAETVVEEAETAGKHYREFAEEIERDAKALADQTTLELRRMHDAGEICKKARETYFKKNGNGAAQ